ncbi:MAG: hypothetical protein ACREAM_01335 [Blastocatellia bacterium]
MQKHDPVIIISAYLRTDQFPSRGNQRLFSASFRRNAALCTNEAYQKHRSGFWAGFLGRIFGPDFWEDNGRII